MKKLLITLSLLGSITALGCEQYELQFIGRIDSVEQGETSCHVNLKSPLRFAARHVLCPLYEEELMATGVTIPGDCSLIEDAPLSGVAVRKVGEAIIALD